jgi:L-alanine-DL-glutamate epimerase-like enolase superfamily enzyme
LRATRFAPYGAFLSTRMKNGPAKDYVIRLTHYGITWFEEALPPDDIEGFIKLR